MPYQRSLKKSKSLLSMLTAIATALLLSACAGPEEEPEAAAPAATETPRSLPSGGDYHSTVIRARGRTNERLETIEQTRSEQVKEEENFSKH